MRLKRKEIVAVAAGVLVSAAAGADVARGSAITGPSNSKSPYLLRSQPGVVTQSILTVGDPVNDRPERPPA